MTENNRDENGKKISHARLLLEGMDKDGVACASLFYAIKKADNFKLERISGMPGKDIQRLKANYYIKSFRLYSKEVTTLLNLLESKMTDNGCAEAKEADLYDIFAQSLLSARNTLYVPQTLNHFFQEYDSCKDEYGMSHIIVRPPRTCSSVQEQLRCMDEVSAKVEEESRLYVLR